MKEKTVKIFKKVIKPIFIISILILLFSEFLNLSKEISYDQVCLLFKTIPFYKLVLMGILGVLSVFPMVYYEVIFSRISNLDFERKYIYETSLSINTLNAIIGFGGVINLGLRLNYYGKNKNEKDLVRLTLEMYPYYFTGFFPLSLLSLIYLLFTSASPLSSYRPWLFAGIIYTPLVFFFLNRVKRISIPKKEQVNLTLSSLGEWVGAIVFFMSIGYILQIIINPLEVFVLLVAANIIAMASMIPGGIGSFDFIVLSGLRVLGISNEVAITWILLYRIFYYILPAIFGTRIFFKYVIKSINTKNGQVLSKIFRTLGHGLATILIYLFAIFLILSATIPDEINHNPWLSKLNPIQASQIYNLPSLILGLIFILVGRAYREKVKRSLPVLITSLIMTMLYAYATNFGISSLIYLGFLLVLVYFAKEELYKTQFIYSPEGKTIDGLLVIILSILFIVFGHHYTPSKNIFLNAKDFIIIPFYKNWFRISLILVVVAVFLIIIYKILEGNRKSVGEKPNLEKVESLLEKYGGTINSALVYLEDKDIYYYENEEGEVTAALQFVTVKDKVIVMSEPMGKKEDYENLIDQFIDEVDTLCYNTVFYEVGGDLALYLHEYGYDFFKFGESATVDLENFSLDGRSMKKQRHILNKMEKEGYEFSVKNPPFDHEFMDKLEAISKSWLGGRLEKGFSLGFFKRDYLSRAPIAIIENSQGEIIAFANLMPVYEDGESTVDLMRYDFNLSPNATMDYLFTQIFLYFKESKKKYFSMGMAPLSNVGVMRYSFIEEKIAYLVYKFGDHFYSFEGLRSFKEKYAHYWKPLYICYSKESWLIYSMVSLLFINLKSLKFASKFLVRKKKYQNT